MVSVIRRKAYDESPARASWASSPPLGRDRVAHGPAHHQVLVTRNAMRLEEERRVAGGEVTTVMPGRSRALRDERR